MRPWNWKERRRKKIGSQYSKLKADEKQLKTNTRKQLYRVAVMDSKGKTYATVNVDAEGVRDALKKAYEKVSGWQGVPFDSLA